eukprot:gene4265-5337_t
MSNPPPNPSGPKPTRLKTMRTPSETINSAGPSPNVTPSGGSSGPQSSRQRKEFAPIIVPRKKKDDKLDSLLTGPITDLIKDALNPISQVTNKKPPARQLRAGLHNPSNRRHTQSLSSASGFNSSAGGNDNYNDSNNNWSIADRKKDEKLNEELLNRVFHEMEIDPLHTFHPTHLPLVDPRKIMKEYSLSDAKTDILNKKKELESKILNGELSDQSTFTLENTNSSSNPKEGEKNMPFHNNGVFLNTDKIYFIQLPTSLPSTSTKPKPPPTGPVMPPHLIQPQQPPQPQAKQPPTNPQQPSTQPNTNGTNNNNEPPPLNKKSFVPWSPPDEHTNTLKELPSGRLGTLKIYKSGKTVLKIGPVEYDISASDKLKFLEEVKCFSHEGPTCYTLGSPVQHLVAAPCINTELKS